MRRRDFVGVVTIASVGLARFAFAQTKINLPTIGLLMPMKEGTDLAKLRQDAFRAGLAAEGFVDGSNYLLLTNFLGGDFNRIEPVVQELGLLKPRVAAIAAMGINAFHQQYPETPIVFTGIAADPIALGWVQSYAHPGGMLTGNVMNAVGGEETMAQKRLGFFREIVPDASKIGIVGSGTNPVLVKEREALHKVAGQFGFEVLHYKVGRRSGERLFYRHPRRYRRVLYLRRAANVQQPIEGDHLCCGLAKANVRTLSGMGTGRLADVVLARSVGGIPQRWSLCSENLEGRQTW